MTDESVTVSYDYVLVIVHGELAEELLLAARHHDRTVDAELQLALWRHVGAPGPSRPSLPDWVPTEDDLDRQEQFERSLGDYDDRSVAAEYRRALRWLLNDRRQC